MDLALSMIDGPNGYFRGVQVDHVLELKNNGPLVANEILVQISLPANASSISTTNPSCSLNQGRVPFLSCIYGSLAANTTNSIPFSFVIDESQVAEEVQLRAQVRGAVNDFDITNDALDITLTPFDVAVVPTTGSDFVLKIIETVDPVTEGELLGYILEVTNAGPEVGKATVSATYPEGTTPPTTCQAQSKKAECNIGVLEVNASKQFLFSIKGDTRNTPFIEATVTATSTNDPDLSNNSTKQKTDVTPLPPAPNKADLVMRVMNLSVAQVDGEALFALSVKNLSNKVARNTQVVITASDGLSYKKPLLSECVQLGAVLTCDLATIQALQEVGLVVEMETGSEVGTETMRFEVSSDTEDPVSENNVLTHSLSLVSQPVSDLRIIESQTQLDKNIATTNSVNVSALAFQVSGADSTLTALNLKTIGTGNDAIDLSSVKLWEDKNGDGLVNAGDVQLSQGNFALDDGGVRLELQTPLNVSEPVNLLVTVDINSRLARNFGILMAFSLLSFGLVKRLRRNRYVSGALTIVLVITLLALVSCGGQTVKQSITQPPVTKPNQPPQPNQPTVSTKQVNFQLTLESVEAIVPSTNTVNVIGLPIKGTTLTIFE